MLKTGLFLLGLFIASNTFAEFNFNGIYKFSGNLTVTVRKVTEHVYTQIESGRQRLKELQNQHYTCVYKSQSLFECSIFLKKEHPLELNAKEKILDLVKNTEVIFDDMNGTPDIITSSESMKEWFFNQEVIAFGKRYQNFRLLETQGLNKIFLGNPVDLTFIAEKNEILKFPKIVTMSESRNRNVLFVIETEYINF